MNIQIDTTQNVTIEYEVAGLGDRLLASLLDLAIKIGYLVLMLLLGSALYRFITSLMYENVRFVLMIIFILFPLMFYTLAFELFMDGQTIGKRTLKIKVVKLDGTPATAGSFIIRWLLRLIDINIFMGGIAILTILINGKGQRLGDIAAATTVIKLKPRAHLSDTLLVSVPTNYQPKYMQVTQLSDKDMNIIKDTFEKCKRYHDRETIGMLYTKVINLLGIENEIKQTEYLDTIYRKQLEFLDTIIKDYFHLTGK